MTTAYPPAVHHPSTHLSTPETLSLLSAYLDAATTDPSLHPSAHLTEHGPVAPSSGPNTGLVLHNLRRVEAGLRGENLGEDLTLRKDGGDGLPGLMMTMMVAADGGGGAGGGGAGEDGRDGASSSKEMGDVVEMGGGGEWQDKAEFERQQEVVRGDIGKRDSAVEGGFEEEGGYVPRVKTTWGPGDKDAKKKAKKDRRKKHQMEDAARRQREKDAEKG